jgi:hypothetical protein
MGDVSVELWCPPAAQHACFWSVVAVGIVFVCQGIAHVHCCCAWSWHRRMGALGPRLSRAELHRAPWQQQQAAFAWCSVFPVFRIANAEAVLSTSSAGVYTHVYYCFSSRLAALGT